MSFYERHKPVILGAVLAIVLVSLSLGLAYLVTYGLPLSDRFSAMQLFLSTVAFVGVFIALMVAIAQFRKSMAKPRIKVAFNEKGEQQATLIYKGGKPNALPSLWLINEGNAISRYFQIDFIIPENIGKQSQYVSIARDDGKYIISYTNDGRYTLFVNKPYLDPNIIFSAAIDKNKCINVPGNSFEIKYRVYGDWAETQEGKLKVNINKQ